MFCTATTVDDCLDLWGTKGLVDIEPLYPGQSANGHGRYNLTSSEVNLGQVVAQD